MFTTAEGGIPVGLESKTSRAVGEVADGPFEHMDEIVNMSKDEFIAYIIDSDGTRGGRQMIGIGSRGWSRMKKIDEEKLYATNLIRHFREPPGSEDAKRVKCSLANSYTTEMNQLSELRGAKVNGLTAPAAGGTESTGRKQ